MTEPPLVPITEPAADIDTPAPAPAPTLSAEAKLTSPPDVSEIPPPPVADSAALTLMLLAALSASVLPLAQLTAFDTVIVPACVPLEPVDTVTLAVPSAFCSVVVLMTVLLAPAAKPPVPALAALEIVTL